MDLQPTSSPGFLGEAPLDDERQRLFDSDLADHGYVMNLSRLWAHQVRTHDGLGDLLRQVAESGELDLRTRAVLIAASASTLGDSYCSLAWGSRLATATDPDTAGAVLAGDDDRLTERERALAGWARAVARDPNATTTGDVQALRDHGFDDATIVAVTAFVALRLAFSTVNDALGARPDAALRTIAPPQVLAAVSFGRAIDDPPPDRAAVGPVTDTTWRDAAAEANTALPADAPSTTGGTHQP